MAGFVEGYLNHPVQHGRSVQVPLAGFHSTNGVAHDFGLSIPELGGGFGSVYDRGSNYNNGVNSTNQPITKQFAQKTDLRWSADDSGLEQLVFTRTGSSNRAYDPDCYIVSLYALNHYLFGKEGREEYKNDHLFEKFFKDWKFAGVQKSKESQEAFINTNTRVMTVTVAKRAQIPDITRAQQGNKANRRGVVNENDVLWLIPRRYQDKNRECKFYHQIDIYVTTSRVAPGPAYTEGYLDNSNVYWISCPIRVGFVDVVHGDRTFSTSRSNTARDVLCGSSGDTSKRWSQLNGLTRIDLMLGVNH